MTEPAARDYKNTLNLPQTAFPMAANLTKLEPKLRQEWEDQKLYEQIRQARRGKTKYILHDGPPYANGDVHVGTGQNKVLKDIVVRYKTMRGFDAPFVPGWDCHGLPIELKVVEKLGARAKTMDKAEIRRQCEEFAMNYVDIQRRQFKNLGVLGDWEKPYLTMEKSYEVAILEVFADLAAKGHVAKRNMPIHWCMNCQTALAEAEIEYKDKQSPSIFIAFELVRSSQKFDRPADLLVWTTTPWTLPGDVATAVHPELDYAVVEYSNSGTARLGILSKPLIEKLTPILNLGKTLTVLKGRDLEGWQYKHPLSGHPCPVVLAEYVKLDEGTGCVHTAPGHGQEDYQTGVKYKLPVLSPVDEAGRFTREAGPYAGKKVFEANPLICADLKTSHVLLRQEEITHSYPCCWRCKNSVIFRATEQWFILVDHHDGRRRALEEVEETRWVPAWGETRITSMLQERPDWVISRQRSWGVPIPVFYCSECRDPLLTRESLAAAIELFKKGGANAWFTTPEKDILPSSEKCSRCGAASFKKEMDIFDVWFESAASHRAVTMKHPELAFPADLYLEGTDQHRGWFQVSLLASVLSQGKRPFRTVVTHGFLVDARTGDKLSKSGFLIPVDEVVNKLGADILRLWISSIDFTDDIPMSWEILQSRTEPYKKIRNTFRYLLGNLTDFDPARDAVPRERMLDIDRWAIMELHQLIREVTEHYENFEFFRVYHKLYTFCVVQMSAVYFGILKDRLYTLGKTSVERRSGQTVLYEMLTALTRMYAPILCHTMEEVWSATPGRDAERVTLADWPASNPSYLDKDLKARWEKLFAVRADVYRELEKKRAAKEIGSSLEAGVELHTSDAALAGLLKQCESTLPAFFIVSHVHLASEPPEDGVAGTDAPSLSLRAMKSPHPKCARCWNQSPEVGRNTAHPTLCGRCIKVVA